MGYYDPELDRWIEPLDIKAVRAAYQPGSPEFDAAEKRSLDLIAKRGKLPPPIEFEPVHVERPYSNVVKEKLRREIQIEVEHLLRNGGPRLAEHIASNICDGLDSVRPGWWYER